MCICKMESDLLRIFSLNSENKCSSKLNNVHNGNRYKLAVIFVQRCNLPVVLFSKDKNCLALNYNNRNAKLFILFYVVLYKEFSTNNPRPN